MPVCKLKNDSKKKQEFCLHPAPKLSYLKVRVFGFLTSNVDFIILIFFDAFNERPVRFLGPSKRGKPDREIPPNAS